MEIRNNTPSFGMALRKPSSEHVHNFAEYVMSSTRPSIAKRGLKQIKREQAKNPHFDMEIDSFLSGGRARFSVIPTSEKAKSMYNTAYVSCKTEEYATGFDKALAKSQANIDAAEKSGSKLRQYWANTVGFIKAIGLLVKTVVFNPKDFLPIDIRYAADVATSRKNAVVTQIAREKAVDKILN